MKVYGVDKSAKPKNPTGRTKATTDGIGAPTRYTASKSGRRVNLTPEGRPDK